jgi:RNA polymerase sigma-70 factor (sigma-E family)
VAVSYLSDDKGGLVAEGWTDRELDEFLAERGTLLIHTAVMLAGGREAGEDLMQAALERLIRHRRRIEGDPEGYLRRVLYNLAADSWRRESRWRTKLPLLRQAAAARSADATAEVDVRDALMRTLLQLPAGQRAVLVLRYWEQLSEAETAAALKCSVGTVKSAASRGLGRMRELAASWEDTASPAGGEDHEYRR